MKPTMFLIIGQGELKQWWQDDEGNGQWVEIPSSRFAYPNPPDSKDYVSTPQEEIP